MEGRNVQICTNLKTIPQNLHWVSPSTRLVNIRKLLSEYKEQLTFDKIEAIQSWQDKGKKKSIFFQFYGD